MEPACLLYTSSCRQEGIRCQGRLGNTQKHRRTGSLAKPLFPSLNPLADLLVLNFKVDLFNKRTRKKLRIAGLVNTDFLHHLPYDNFDMLIVNINTLHAVNALYFLDQVILYGLCTADSEDIMRVDGTLCNSGTRLDPVSYTHLDVYKRQGLCPAS